MAKRNFTQMRQRSGRMQQAQLARGPGKSRRFTPRNDGWQPTVRRNRRNRIPLQMGLKYLTNNAIYSGSNVGTIVDLSLLPVGAAQAQREGSVVNVTSLQIRAWFASKAYAAAGLPGTINSTRLIIFQWFPPTVPAGTDILQDSAAYPTVRGYNQNTAGTYQIMYDESIVLTKAGASAASPFGGVDSTWTKLNNFKVTPKEVSLRYSTADATGATGTNKIYMALYTNTNTAEDIIDMIATIKLNYRD